MSWFFKLSLLFVCISSLLVEAQQSNLEAQDYLNRKGEVYFSFDIQSRKELAVLTRIISIDKENNHKVFAYANNKEFELFLKLNYDFKVLPHPGDDFLSSTKNTTSVWINNTEFSDYPTYWEYAELMESFELKYPNLCTLVSLGTTPDDHEIYFLKISDNVSSNEGENKFMYTSTMHGDETAGYLLMLQFIDHLLANYGTDDQITNLVNNLEIWINPLANPDGTYASSDMSVIGSTRNNANNEDLNRNFPNPEFDGIPYSIQPETQMFIDFAEEHDFGMSANFHGGTVVVNYPWDTWSALHEYNNWFIYTSQVYASAAQNASSNTYFTDYENGITNGYAWYQAIGTRQDYMNYYKNCREVTIELSNTKLLPFSSLPTYWEYNRQALLDFMKEATNLNTVIIDTPYEETIIKYIFNSKDLNIETSEDVKLTIYSINGCAVFNTDIQKGINEIALDNTIKSGVYLVSVKGEKTHKQKKILVW